MDLPSRLSGTALALLIGASIVVPPSSSALTPSRSTCPLPRHDFPCLVASPASGPTGTQIRLSGSVADLNATDRRLLTSGLIGLIRDIPGCEIVAGAGHPRLHVTNAGRISMVAPLIVPRQGSCNHSDNRHPVTPGRYAIVAGCFTCDVAYFQVTNGRPALANTGAPLNALAAVGLVAVAGGAWLSRRYRRTA